MENKKEEIEVQEKFINTEKLKNIKELEKTKKTYLRLRNTVLVILLIVFIIAIILCANFTYRYIQISKIIKDNIAVDLGDNFKLGYYYYKEELTFDNVIYVKDGLTKRVISTNFKNGEGWEEEFIENIDGYNYEIVKIKRNNGEEIKQFSKNKIDIDDEKNNISVFNLLGGVFSTNNQELNFIDISSIIIKYNARVEKEIYNNKEYKVLRVGQYGKCYINPETNYVEKTVSSKPNETYSECNIVIEKDVVKDEIKLPDLSDFKEEE